MNIKELSEKLHLDLSEKLKLDISRKQVQEIIGSLLREKPELRQLLQNKKEFTKDDLKLVFANLTSVKKIDTKKFIKSYLSVCDFYSQGENVKPLAYETVKLALFAYIILMIKISRKKNKLKKQDKIT